MTNIMSSEKRLVDNVIVDNELGGADHRILESTVRIPRLVDLKALSRPKLDASRLA